MSSAEKLGKNMPPEAWRHLLAKSRKSLISKEKDAAKKTNKNRHAAKAALLAASWRHLLVDSKKANEINSLEQFTLGGNLGGNLAGRTCRQSANPIRLADAGVKRWRQAVQSVPACG